MTRSDIIKKKAMIDALVKSLGVVTLACKEVGIARQTHYVWYNEDLEYKKAVDDISDVALDFAESILFKKIQDKDTIATIFYLKTKGKKRGYVERQETEHSGIPAPINIIVGSKENAEKLKDFMNYAGKSN